jgi:hypothetical protein
MIVVGAILLGWFIIVGGPNKGQGEHILSDTLGLQPDNLYLDMQAGLTLLVFGTLLGIINRAVTKR